VKDNRTEIIEKLIERNWPNKKAFAESIDIPYTTLASMLSRGIGNASVNNVLKVCKGLNITIDELEKMAEGDDFTIAAHHDGEVWSEDELEEIEKFREYLKSKRDN
jgi:predicted transcriptional regulator